MRNTLLAATALLGFAASPAFATLQIAGTINSVNFLCVDNAACDSNLATGTIQLTNQTIGGIVVDGSIQSSKGTPANPGPIDILNTSSLSISNPTAGTISGTVAVSDTSFSAPVTSIALSGSGVWEAAIGSNAVLRWFADTANGQGADNATDTPGTLLDTNISNAALLADSFSHSSSVAFAANSPFSMTEQVAFSLTSNGTLLNRGQTELATVPEPASMLVLGMGLVGIAAVRRRSV